jgi:hypothetical protein
MGMESCVIVQSKCNDGTVDSLASPLPSRGRLRSRRGKKEIVLNSTHSDSSAAAGPPSSTSQRVDSPHTNARARELRPSASLADAHKRRGTIKERIYPAQAGEEAKETTTEFDDKSNEAPSKDHSAIQAGGVRKSSESKARTLRAQRERTAHGEQHDANMKVGRKHKKGRKAKSRCFYELQIPASCDTPVSALSMDDLERVVRMSSRGIFLGLSHGDRKPARYCTN